MATTTTKTAEKTARRQRGVDGRFVTGGAGGPGRPKAEREVEYLRVAKETISPPMIAQVLLRMHKLAINGSVRAAELILRHYLPAAEHRQQLDISFGENDGTFRIDGEDRTATLIRALRIVVAKTKEVHQENQLSLPSLPQQEPQP